MRFLLGVLIVVGIGCSQDGDEQPEPFHPTLRHKVTACNESHSDGWFTRNTIEDGLLVRSELFDTNTESQQENVYTYNGEVLGNVTLTESRVTRSHHHRKRNRLLF